MYYVLMSDPIYIDAVCASVFHPSGTVLATCSGQRHIFQPDSGSQSESDDDDDISSSVSLSSSSSPSSNASSGSTSISASIRMFDNSLKIWAL